MAGIIVLFRCGHQGTLSPKAATPTCTQCGASGVARVLSAPMPRFTGHGSGPLLTPKNLKPKKVNLAPDGPLKEKPKARDEATS